MLVIKQIAVDWKMGSRGGEDRWTRADKLVRKRRSGKIKNYNTVYQRVKNMHHIVAKSLTISGLLVSCLLYNVYEQEFYATILQSLAAGEIQDREEVTSWGRHFPSARREEPGEGGRRS
ncbi:hypothetical protein C8R44DRAFT_889460 [Mycena epipterygia]|nr:hypothetical protein C8R44DRAFT_889460 [Mycena epipterygia]